MLVQRGARERLVPIADLGAGDQRAACCRSSSWARRRAWRSCTRWPRRCSAALVTATLVSLFVLPALYLRFGAAGEREPGRRPCTASGARAAAAMPAAASVDGDRPTEDSGMSSRACVAFVALAGRGPVTRRSRPAPRSRRVARRVRIRGSSSIEARATTSSRSRFTDEAAKRLGLPTATVARTAGTSVDPLRRADLRRAGRDAGSTRARTAHLRARPRSSSTRIDGDRVRPDRGPAGGDLGGDDGRRRAVRRRARASPAALTTAGPRRDAPDRRHEPAVPLDRRCSPRRGDDGLRLRADPADARSTCSPSSRRPGSRSRRSRSASPPSEVEELVTVPIEQQLNGIAGLDDMRSKSVAAALRDRADLQPGHRRAARPPAGRRAAARRSRRRCRPGPPAGHAPAAVGDQPGDEDRPDLGRGEPDRHVDDRVLEDPGRGCCGCPASPTSRSGASGSTAPLQVDPGEACRARRHARARSWMPTRTPLDAGPAAVTPTARSSAPAASSRPATSGSTSGTSCRSWIRTTSAAGDGRRARTARPLRARRRRRRRRGSPAADRRCRHQRRPGPLARRPEVPRGQHARGDPRASRQAIEEMRPGLPDIAIDTTIFRPATFIEQSIDNLTTALLIGVVLVVLIIVALPVRVADRADQSDRHPAVTGRRDLVLDLAGTTINTMVLAGLVIAIGVVVDDAIIDVENIVRRLRQARARGQPRSTVRHHPRRLARGAQRDHVRNVDQRRRRRAGAVPRGPVRRRSSGRWCCRTGSPCWSRWWLL